MKQVTIKMVLLLEDGSKPDYWVFQSVVDQLKDFEDIVEFSSETIDDVEPESNT